MMTAKDGPPEQSRYPERDVSEKGTTDQAVNKQATRPERLGTHNLLVLRNVYGHYRQCDELKLMVIKINYYEYYDYFTIYLFTAQIIDRD